LVPAIGLGAAFEQIVVDPDYVAYQRDVGDIDGDGDNDLVAVQEGDTTLQVFRAPAWERSTLIAFSEAFSFPRADDLKLADIDRDGDLDVVTRLGGGPTDDGVGVAVWCENGSESAGFTWHRIGRSPEYVKDIVVVDLDRDGRPDVIMRMDRQTQIWLQDAENGWNEVLLAHPPHEGMAAGDVDGDGDSDLVMNGFWFPTPDTPTAARLATNYGLQIIDDSWFNQTGDWTKNSCKVVVADFDADGTNEVAFSQSERAGYEVAWYRRDTSGVSESWNRHPVAVVDYCHTLQSSDFDLDGDVDLLAGGMIQSQHRGLRLFVNEGRGARWSALIVQTDGSYSAEVGDVDKDGDPDVVGIRNWNSPPTWIYRNNIRARHLTEPK
jgi:hypothetical protein